MKVVSFLQKDKSYFIMQDGEVKTYHSSNVEGDVLVYDRTNLNGVTPLNTREVRRIITEGSKAYMKELKDFIQFLHNDLKDRPTLRSYILSIWNGQTTIVHELSDEDCTLDDQFAKYMETLIVREDYDNDVVRYFYEVFYKQELIYDKYSENWLNHNKGSIREYTDKKVQEL